MSTVLCWGRDTGYAQLTWEGCIIQKGHGRVSRKAWAFTHSQPSSYTEAFEWHKITFVYRKPALTNARPSPSQRGTLQKYCMICLTWSQDKQAWWTDDFFQVGMYSAWWETNHKKGPCSSVLPSRFNPKIQNQGSVYLFSICQVGPRQRVSEKM